jgi:hypothetical protein
MLVVYGRAIIGEEEGLQWLADCSHGDEAVLGKVRIRSRGMTESLNKRVKERVSIDGFGMPTFWSIWRQPTVCFHGSTYYGAL